MRIKMKINGYEIRPKANLQGADLQGADLWEANLQGADLSGTKIFSATKWMVDNFKSTKAGWVVYKDIKSTFYSKPKTWKFEPGRYLEEVCNLTATDSCGCGVNFATKKWLANNSKNDICECLIEWVDAIGIVVPYNTDGKARCSRLKLIKKI